MVLGSGGRVRGCGPRLYLAFVLVAAAGLLLGCASPSSPTVRVFASVLGPVLSGPVSTQAMAARLNPALTYLYLAETGRAPVFLALGYIDPGEPPTLVWYSAELEVLRTRSGRLVGLSGAPDGPSAVRFEPGFPTWSAALGASGAGLGFERIWDFPLRYRFGQVDRVQMSAVAWQQVPPELLRHVRSSLGSSAYSQWQWFQESSTLMPSAWFAVALVAGQPQVVYSYQCLSPQRCFHLAPWPIAQIQLP